MSKGALVVMSGPSGVGKSTIIARLLRRPNRRLGVSATTRAPREGERDGRDYRFVTHEAFQQMIREDALLEWAEVHGNLYGTPADEVTPWIDRGFTVILDIDQQGFRAIRQKRALVSIFIMPPSLEVLGARLRARGSETEDARARRLRKAAAEMAAAPAYDHVVVNDDLDRAVADVEAILGPGP